MVGLRMPEGNKFIKFFDMVQKEAKKKNAIFFIDNGQGKLYEDDTIECEDMWGWLIPFEAVDKFNIAFEEWSQDVHEYDDHYAYVGYEILKDGRIEISIDDSKYDFDLS